MLKSLKPQKKVRFVKAFTSPVLGNVWLDREATIDAKLADNYITAGVAVEADAKAAKKAATPADDAAAKAAKKAADDKAAADAKAAEDAALATLKGSNVQPAQLFFKKGNAKKQRAVALGHVVTEAFEESELDVTEWNALPDADREKHIADTVQRLKLSA